MDLKHSHSILDMIRPDSRESLPKTGSSGQDYRSAVSDRKDLEEATILVWKPTREMFFNWRGYIWAALLTGAVTCIGLFGANFVSLENILMLYLLIVVVTAIYWGLGPSILISCAIVAVLDYFFIQPFMGFIPFRLDDVVTLLVLLLVSVLISYLASRFRQKSEEARRRELEISSLYAISRDLNKFTELESSIQTIMQMGKKILGNNLTIFLPDPQKKIALVPYNSNPDYPMSALEYTIADWAFQNHHPAGQGTDSFPESRTRFQPLMTPRGAVGVMALWEPANNSQLPQAERIRLVQAFTDLVAVCIENINLAEEAKKAEVLKATEKLQTAVLNSLSHDLRTPLVSVIGVLSSLQEEGLELDAAARSNLIQVARDDAERLNSLIANLLDISRIEAGAIKLVKQPSDVADLIGVALERLGNRATNRQIEIAVPSEMPLVNVDFNLMVQVLFNILDNAIKYSPKDSPIDVNARQTSRKIEVEVSDHGIGIIPGDLTHVFEKFYRGQRQGHIYGTGLGLSICKGIVESHGGHIAAENRLGGGTIIRVTLPADGASPKED